MLIDPELSTQVEKVTVSVRNSDGRDMSFSARRWGTKINISFMIDDTTPDGVSIIDIDMSGRSIANVKERFDFWVIK